MQRGEVWWADLPAPAGTRPVLLLTRNTAYAVRESVTVAPITRTIRHIPVEVSLGPDEGMPADCVINADDILTIRKRRLRGRITTIGAEKMAAVATAVKFALDLP